MSRCSRDGYTALCINTIIAPQLTMSAVALFIAYNEGRAECGFASHRCTWHAGLHLTQFLLDTGFLMPGGLTAPGTALMSGLTHQSMSRPASPPQSSSSLWGQSLAAAGSVSDTCSCPPCMSLLDISAQHSAVSCFHVSTPPLHLHCAHFSSEPSLSYTLKPGCH